MSVACAVERRSAVSWVFNVELYPLHGIPELVYCILIHTASIPKDCGMLI